MGGVDYISKPFYAEEVLSRINTHLALSFLQRRLEEKNTELQNALNEIRILRGILPVCAYCKRIRNDKGQWEQMESYIRNRSQAEFSHGICEECSKRIDQELEEE